MPRGGANFTSQELAVVLSNYDLGPIDDVRALNIGNRKAPKRVITSSRGKFLLKRRARGKDDIYHVSFSHSINKMLEKKDFPVPVIIETRSGQSALEMDGNIYEMFEYVPGRRFDNAPEQCFDAGRNLAFFHEHLKSVPHQLPSLTVTFHDSVSVRRHLKNIVHGKSKAMNDRNMTATAEKILEIYNIACINVNQLGFDSWPALVVHSDWHPGNMLFEGDKVKAVLDFDSVRFAPVVTDIANGLLQFSIIAGDSDCANWPDHPDSERLLCFIRGYESVSHIEEDRRQGIGDLMIETMIAESVLPIAATGFFGHQSGSDFLCMIMRKSEWIMKNHDTIDKLLSEKCSK